MTASSVHGKSSTYRILHCLKRAAGLAGPQGRMLGGVAEAALIEDLETGQEKERSAYRVHLLTRKAL